MNIEQAVNLIVNVFDPALHPRESDGKFGDGSSGIEINHEGDSEAAIKTLYPHLSADDLAKASGAVAGSKVTFRKNLYDLEVEIDHKDFWAVRSLQGDKISNSSLMIKYKARDAGTGTELFASQVDSASKAGFKEITARATRGDDNASGYYALARWGYQGKTNDGKDIQELMKTKEGRAQWKKHGHTFSGTFDLKEGSESRKILDKYAKEKSKST